MTVVIFCVGGAIGLWLLTALFKNMPRIFSGCVNVLIGLCLIIGVCALANLFGFVSIGIFDAVQGWAADITGVYQFDPTPIPVWHP